GGRANRHPRWHRSACECVQALRWGSASGSDVSPSLRQGLFTEENAKRLSCFSKPSRVAAVKTIHNLSMDGWEAPDPAYWVPRGYVVINADLRGWGRSDGVGDL